jgi:uncharacterized protein DUF4411
MIYIFDTSPFITIFTYYFRKRFPSLWEKFDALIEDGRIISTCENFREIEPINEDLFQWARNNDNIFLEPNRDEALFIRDIYKVKHFQQNIEQKKLWQGGNNADSFVIAKAYVIEGTVVTGEIFKPNAVKVPNICKHFNISCLDLEQFMEKENWIF